MNDANETLIKARKMSDVYSTGLSAVIPHESLPAINSNIEIHGGFGQTGINLAYYYPSTKEVFYLGSMYQISIQNRKGRLPVSRSFRVITTNKYAKIDDDMSVDLDMWCSVEGFRNLHNIIDRMVHVEMPPRPYSDIVGNLIGFIDLVDGSQFRFIFDGFILTDIGNHWSRGNKEVAQVNVKGQPNLKYLHSTHYEVIEEQKKIDYTKVREITL